MSAADLKGPTRYGLKLRVVFFEFAEVGGSAFHFPIFLILIPGQVFQRRLVAARIIFNFRQFVGHQSTRLS